MLSELKRDLVDMDRRLEDLRVIFDLAAKEARLALIDADMSTATFWDDSRKAQALVQERAELSRTVTRFQELSTQGGEVRLLWEMATEAGDESLAPEISQDIARVSRDLEAFELRIVLSGPQDKKNAILSIHPGAGGTESQDWAQMLMRMYLRWTERAGLRAEVVDVLPGEEAGIKSATITVHGEYAYGYLKGEIGVHRLIRISPFDASKRRHTSFASVAAIPEVEDVEVVIKDEELRVDVYRSSGPGGQGVNTADSAVRITHLPSGLVVACQNERSQLRNRDTALRILKSRLFQIYEKRQKEELAELAGEKKDSAFGSQIRTYTFHPYQIIKDHRTGIEVGNVEAVMDGDLDPFIRAFLALGKSA
ncbi:MAG: peptide chain release factor 2 [Candidatus Rokubacteria bacterium]|nr:peptide chain release factor 2 [Candidatus Rokubacteria bacterium]MBI3104184.1 peptide chain release factor 2 [Candidatus Rokubacteria bacterium]